MERAAVQPRETVVLPGAAVRLEGADGVPATLATAVTLFEGVLAPAGLFAVTWNRYVSPLTSPVTVWERRVAATLTMTENVAPPSVLCQTSYDVSAAPFEFSGEDQPRYAVVP